MKRDNNEETHKFLPSGKWEGFYCYQNSSMQHKMDITLLFNNNEISGNGIDDVDKFIWKGKYDLKVFKAVITKIYPTHNILYSGDIDENGIWGIWNAKEDLSKFDYSPELINNLKNLLKGGFHIWPKQKEHKSEEMKEEENVKKSIKLEEIFIKHFE